MEFALEVSFYALAVIFGLGVLMVLVLVKDVFFHGRFTTVLPPHRRVPTGALDEARQVLTQLKAAYAVAQGEVKNVLLHEIQHLEHHLPEWEDRTYRDQSDYHAAAEARERAWREWRALHQEAQQEGFAKRKEMRIPLDEAKTKYNLLNREVEEEYQRASARDTLMLDDLKSQGFLRPEVLFPPDGADPLKQAEGMQEPSGSAEAEQQGGDTEDSAQQTPADTAPQPVRNASKWSRPLAPYPPAAWGELRQEHLSQSEVQKSERTYVDPTMIVEGLPGGMISRANFSLSSFAEVEMVGLHRYLNCTFVGTDLRRIELQRVAGVHVFQDCAFKGASLGQSLLCDVIFRRCDLSSTHWKGARLDRVKFEQCNLEGIHWESVDLSRCVVSGDMMEPGLYAGASQPPHNLTPPSHLDDESAPPPEAPGPGAPEAPPMAGGDPDSVPGQPAQPPGVTAAGPAPSPAQAPSGESEAQPPPQPPPPQGAAAQAESPEPMPAPGEE